jgi:hypothetical protein
MTTDEQLMAPELVLQEAREMRRYYDGEKKPYTAGVIGDCIATIETLQTQLAARQAAAHGAGEALDQIIGHLGAALVQASPTDDQIIMDHVRVAHELAKTIRRRA